MAATPSKGKGGKAGKASIYNTWNQFALALYKAPYRFDPYDGAMTVLNKDGITGPFYDDEGNPLFPPTFKPLEVVVDSDDMATAAPYGFQFEVKHPIRGALSFRSQAIMSHEDIGGLIETGITPDMRGATNQGWAGINMRLKNPYRALMFQATSIMLSLRASTTKSAIVMMFTANRAGFSSDEAANRAFFTYLAIYSIDNLARILGMSVDAVVTTRIGTLTTMDDSVYDLPLPTGVVVLAEHVKEITVNGGEIMGTDGIRVDDKTRSFKMSPVVFSMANPADPEDYQFFDLYTMILFATGIFDADGNLDLKADAEGKEVPDKVLQMQGKFLIELSRISVNQSGKKEVGKRNTSVSIKYYNLRSAIVDKWPTIVEPTVMFAGDGEEVTKTGSNASMRDLSSIF